MSALRSAALGLVLGAAALLTGPASAHAIGLPRPAVPADLLTVSYDDGTGHPRTYALTCDAKAGNATADSPDGSDGSGGSDSSGGSDGHPVTAAPDLPAQAEPERPAAGSDACARLENLGGPLPAVPPDQACSMLYGGPQTATVRGTWHGRLVDETYRRTNGCEIARWARMTPALPDPVNASPTPTQAVTYTTPAPYNP